MSQLIKAQYQKYDATFSSGAAAHDDKNSFYTPEFNTSVNDCYNAMLSSGVLLQPVYYEWDQETFVLSVCKPVTSEAAYQENVTFDGPTAVDFAEQAGWTFLGVIVETI